MRQRDVLVQRVLEQAASVALAHVWDYSSLWEEVPNQYEICSPALFRTFHLSRVDNLSFEPVEMSLCPFRVWINQ
jgi:hypothetical protein